MSYLALKYLHVACVVLSGLGFFLRGLWMLAESSVLRHFLVRRLPHVVDTLLLVSALILTWMSGRYPFAEPWLTAKLFGLLVYIGLGMMALRRAKTKAARATFFVLALLVYGYIVSVALNRNPLPGF